MGNGSMMSRKSIFEEKLFIGLSGLNIVKLKLWTIQRLVRALNKIFIINTRDLPGVALVITFFHDTFHSSQKNLISYWSSQLSNL